MPSNPIPVPFQKTEAPEPADRRHLMHLAYASNRAIGVLILYGLILLVGIGCVFWFQLPEVMKESVISKQESEAAEPKSDKWERDFLVLIVCSGALGGLAHLFSSLGTYVGERRMLRSWLIYYYFRPIVGGILALFVYFVLRMGVLSPAGATVPQQINVYGVLAFSTLSGLFSRRAIEKLAEIFNILFQKTEEVTSEATVQQLFGSDDPLARLSPQPVPSSETFRDEEQVESPPHEGR